MTHEYKCCVEDLEKESFYADGIEKYGPPPRVDHLDVVGEAHYINEWKPRIHSAPLTSEPGRTVALGRVLLLM
jgi:hypothetical protein